MLSRSCWCLVLGVGRRRPSAARLRQSVFKMLGKTSHVLTGPCWFSGAAPFQLFCGSAVSEWLVKQETHEAVVLSRHFMKFDSTFTLSLVCSVLDGRALLVPSLVFDFFLSSMPVIVFFIAVWSLAQSQSLEVSLAWALVFVLCRHCPTPVVAS